VTYERVRVAGRTLYLRDPREKTLLGKPVLTGIEVNREGDEIASGGADERCRVIDLSLVSHRTPVALDRTYGTLEPA
jgi:hypothetical protein